MTIIAFIAGAAAATALTMALMLLVWAPRWTNATATKLVAGLEDEASAHQATKLRMLKAEREAERLRGGLQWYADGHHMISLDDWDEEESWMCSSTDSAMVEPGHVARSILAGRAMNPNADEDSLTIDPNRDKGEARNS